jgi:hypothetical protein
LVHLLSGALLVDASIGEPEMLVGIDAAPFRDIHPSAA